MASTTAEIVTFVHHWNNELFSFKTTRKNSFRFESGHFVMIGLHIEGKACLRAYSIASPNWEDHLEFFSIKVPTGQLTSRLQNLQEGDEVLVGAKPVGTLVLRDLNPGNRVFLLASGTGLAPFLSIIRDFELYEKFSEIVLIHSVRRVSDLAYRDYLQIKLPKDEYLGGSVSNKLRYVPVVTREDFPIQARIPEILSSKSICSDLNIKPIDPSSDRAMICGSIAMLNDTKKALEDLGLNCSPSQGEAGDFVIERAFVDR